MYQPACGHGRGDSTVCLPNILGAATVMCHFADMYELQVKNSGLRCPQIEDLLAAGNFAPQLHSIPPHSRMPLAEFDLSRFAIENASCANLRSFDEQVGTPSFARIRKELHLGCIGGIIRDGMNRLAG